MATKDRTVGIGFHIFPTTVVLCDSCGEAVSAPGLCTGCRAELEADTADAESPPPLEFRRK